MTYREPPRVHGCLVLFFLVFFFPVGIVLLLVRLSQDRKARRMRREWGARIELYRSLIYEYGWTSLSQIAARVSMSADMVANELEWLARRGDLPGVHIDMQSGRVLYESAAYAQVHVHEHNTYIVTPRHAPSTSGGPPPQEPRPRTIDCAGCGAKVRYQPGEDNRCEYCRTPIHDS